MRKLVIIPTLREYANLRRLIPAIVSFVSDANILVVDDHSQDGTVGLVAEFQENILERKNNPGYGNSILDGLRWAFEKEYDFVVTMDADFSHDPKELPILFEKLQKSDVMIGSRYVPGGSIQNWKLHRRFLSWFAQRYVRIILGAHFHDSTTGFVGMNKKAVSHILNHAPRSKGYSFLVECKYILQQAGFLIGEHPIIYVERREGESKMSWKNIWESVWLPWRLRFKKKLVL